MAIATLDDLVAGLKAPVHFQKVGTTMKAANLWYSYFYTAGIPGAATASADGLGGAHLTSYAGQIRIPATVGGDNIHLARFEAIQLSSIGKLTLLDRLWHNSGFTVTSTSAQTINSGTLSARDANGATAGVGVNLAMEVTATLGSGTPTLTVTYTNSAGTGSRTGTIGPISTTSQIGMFYPMTLQAGDDGVRSVQSITSSATMTSGSVSFVLYREIAGLGMPSANFGIDRDAVALGLPRVYDDSVPFLIGLAQATTATTIDGSVSFAQN